MKKYDFHLIASMMVWFFSGCLHVYVSGALWVAESQGVLKVSNEAGQILFEIPALGVSQIAVDQADAHIWVLDNKSLRAYSANGQLQVQAKLPAVLKQKKTRLMRAGKQIIWLAAGHDLYQFNKQGEYRQSIHFRRPILDISLDTRRERLWVSVPTWVHVLDQDGHDLDRFRLRFPFVAALAYDSQQDQSWLVAGPYLLRLNPETYAREWVSNFGIGFGLWHQLEADGQGGVWGATPTTLSHINAQGDQDIQLKPFQNETGGHHIRGLSVDTQSQHIWLANRNTLKQYDNNGILSIAA